MVTLFVLHIRISFLRINIMTFTNIQKCSKNSTHLTLSTANCWPMRPLSGSDYFRRRPGRSTSRSQSDRLWPCWCWCQYWWSSRRLKQIRDWLHAYDNILQLQFTLLLNAQHHCKPPPSLTHSLTNVTLAQYVTPQMLELILFTAHYMQIFRSSEPFIIGHTDEQTYRQTERYSKLLSKKSNVTHVCLCVGRAVVVGHHNRHITRWQTATTTLIAKQLHQKNRKHNNNNNKKYKVTWTFSS